MRENQTSALGMVIAIPSKNSEFAMICTELLLLHNRNDLLIGECKEGIERFVASMRNSIGKGSIQLILSVKGDKAQKSFNSTARFQLGNNGLEFVGLLKASFPSGGSFQPSVSITLIEQNDETGRYGALADRITLGPDEHKR